MGKIKLYLVKREVRARSIREAILKRGTIYEVTETKDIVDPDKKNPTGFQPKKTS